MIKWSSVDEHLYCFQSFVITNGAAVTKFCTKFIWHLCKRICRMNSQQWNCSVLSPSAFGGHHNSSGVKMPARKNHITTDTRWGNHFNISSAAIEKKLVHVQLLPMPFLKAVGVCCFLGHSESKPLKMAWSQTFNSTSPCLHFPEIEMTSGQNSTRITASV